MTFSLDDSIVITPHQVSCRVGDDVVVLGLSESAYFGLKGAGPFLWENIQTSITVREMRDRMLEEYEVDSHQAETDLQNFLSELMEAKLIEVRKHS